MTWSPVPAPNPNTPTAQRPGVLVLLLALGLPAADAAAESRKERQQRLLKDLTLEELMDVEVRAPTKAEMPIREAPMVGSVITREEIDAYGWLTLADVLLRQPGFSPSQDYERITLSGRGQYESWNNNHIRILIDGVPANSFSNGIGFVWEMVPLSMVETIEIIRGPGSALYGSNALNAVVAINTRKAADMPAVETGIRGGEAGTFWSDFAASETTPWLSAVAGYGYRGTKGNAYLSHDGSGRSEPGGGLRKFEVQDKRSTHTGFLKLEGAGPAEGLSVFANLSWWDFQTGHGWSYIVPDEKERAHTDEALAFVRYETPALFGERLRLEFVAEWLHHAIDYRFRALPDSFALAGTFYPDGITEFAQSAFQDYFVRAQADYRLYSDMRVLFGVENTFQPHHEEGVHQSNVDLNRGGTFKPFPDGKFHDLKPLFESIKDQPFGNSGVFLQWESGSAFTRYLSAVAGVRYDNLYFDYIDLDQASQPIRHRSLEQFSPRLAFVLHPHPLLSLKAIGERSFRTPSPSELFARNSLLGNARADLLMAEEISAFTLAGDLTLFRNLNLRADAFIQDFDNQIAFSGADNYVSNLYSRRVMGIESELRSNHHLDGNLSVDTFLNHTWVHQLEEDALNPALFPSDRLTWGPGHSANVGAAVVKSRLEGSAQAHWQGRVYRRRSDRFAADGTPTHFSTFRPESVAPWVTIDAQVGYRFSRALRVRAMARNLLDQAGYLVKPGDYPFDYRIEGMRLSLATEFSL